EKQPTDIHERTALVFGSKTEVRWVESYELESQQGLDQSPLFSNRNLFRS
ncbi:MAG TPA: class 1 fructose-bisphosphatase, partial [Gammaproteobacteria bacterium]|nr:class 1 fructose-bisphosphatase [Gammaproteobacteria bacterium]